MPFQKFLVPIASVILIVAAYRASGWGGVALAVGVLMMWLLLQFTRMMQVLRRAANRPIGHVGSAVMFNAKLKAGVTLLHVVAMTRALGELTSPKDTQPEIFRWTDETASTVTCEFRNGKLMKWVLERPVQSEDVVS
jgi:Flp pilus assembly protein TadB